MTMLVFANLDSQACVDRWERVVQPYLSRVHAQVHVVTFGRMADCIESGPDQHGLTIIGATPQVALLVAPPPQDADSPYSRTDLSRLSNLARQLDGVLDIPRVVVLPADPLSNVRVVRMFSGRQEAAIYHSPRLAWRGISCGIKNPIGVDPLSADPHDPRVFYLSFFVARDRRVHFRSGWIRP